MRRSFALIFVLACGCHHARPKLEIPKRCMKDITFTKACVPVSESLALCDG